MTKRNQQIFSKNLNYYMKINMTSRKDLAEATEIPYTSIRDYEKGYCLAKMDNIEKIAKFFNISPLKLIEDENTANIMDLVENTEDSKQMLELMTRLANSSPERRKFILHTLDLMDNEKQ